MLRTTGPLAIAAASLLGAAALSGCAASDTKQDTVATPGPLPFDPTERTTLAEWWTDGRQLLRLEPGGEFARYDSLDRYHAPAEHGRWWRQSYAALWLEPYAKSREPRQRVTIAKD